MFATFLLVVAIAIRVLSNPVANVFQKQLTSRGYHPLLVNFGTYLALSLACMPFLFVVPWSNIPTDFWWYAVSGGMAGAAGNGFLVKALEKGELSVLGPINAYKSVIGLIIGFLVLGETAGWWGFIGMSLIVYGSYFVLDSTASGFSWSLLQRNDVRYRFAALILTAIEAVLIKKVILYSSASIAFAGWCVFGAIFSLALLLLYRVPVVGISGLARQQPGKLLFLVLCIGVMQFTTNYVLKEMPVGYALSLFQLSTIASVLLGYRVFGEQGIKRKIAGSIIMIAGSVMIVLLNKS